VQRLPNKTAQTAAAHGEDASVYLLTDRQTDRERGNNLAGRPCYCRSEGLLM